MTAAALNRAKQAKNDEFFTRREDVERETVFYREQFRGKIIFCPCNDGPGTAFVEHFHAQYASLGLKGLVATDYAPVTGSTHGHRYDYGPGIQSTKTERWKPVPPEVSCLKGDGDFRSPEVREMLENPDVVVVTNVPFSLFREILAILDESGRDFLVMGNLMDLSMKEVWSLVQDGRVWLGASGRATSFSTPGGGEKAMGNVVWYTNMEHRRRREEIPLAMSYSREDFPTYDNYDAIEVGRVARIPCDYTGEMGVPVSFMTRFNPDQFEIVGVDETLTKMSSGLVSRFFLGGKKKAPRIVIRNRRVQ